eukprot:Ihof_evm10s231 gene=Ihof_evmTU10s231
MWDFTVLQRLVKFLLKRTIGPYLLDDLECDQLSLSLSEGCVTITDLRLDVLVLNGLLRGTPLAISSGYVGCVKVTIPWRNLMGGNCCLTLSNIKIVTVPTAQVDSDLRSRHFYHDLTERGSVQEQVPIDDDQWDNVPEGVEVVAGWIESIISKIEVRLEDITLRVEGMTDLGQHGLIVRVNSLTYTDATPEPRMSLSEDPGRSVCSLYLPFVIKKLVWGRVTVEIFNSTSPPCPIFAMGSNENDCITRVKYRLDPLSTSNSHPPSHPCSPTTSFSASHDTMEPKYDIEWIFPCIAVVVCPEKIQWLMSLVEIITMEENYTCDCSEEMGSYMNESIYQTVDDLGFSQNCHFFPTDNYMRQADLEAAAELVSEYQDSLHPLVVQNLSPFASMFSDDDSDQEIEPVNDDSNMFQSACQGSGSLSPSSESFYSTQYVRHHCFSPTPITPEISLTSIVIKVRIEDAAFSLMTDPPPDQDDSIIPTIRQYLSGIDKQTENEAYCLPYDHFCLRLCDTIVKYRQSPLNSTRHIHIRMRDAALFEAYPEPDPEPSPRDLTRISPSSMHVVQIAFISRDLNSSTTYQYTQARPDQNTNRLLLLGTQWAGNTRLFSNRYEALRLVVHMDKEQGVKVCFNMRPLCTNLDPSMPLRLAALTSQIYAVTLPSDPEPQSFRRAPGSLGTEQETETQAKIDISIRLDFVRVAIYLPVPTTASKARPLLQNNVILLDVNNIRGDMSLDDFVTDTTGFGSLNAQDISVWLVESEGEESKCRKGIQRGGTVGEEAERTTLIASVVREENMTGEETSLVQMEFTIKAATCRDGVQTGEDTMEGLESKSMAMSVLFEEAPIGLGKGKPPPPTPFSYVSSSCENEKRNEFLTTADDKEDQRFKFHAMNTSLCHMIWTIPIVAITACKHQLDIVYSLYNDWLCWSALTMDLPTSISSDSGGSDEGISDPEDLMQLPFRLTLGKKAAKQLRRTQGPTGYTVAVNVKGVTIALDEDGLSLERLESIGVIRPQLGQKLWRYEGKLDELQVFAAMDYLGLPVKYACFSARDFSLFAVPKGEILLGTRHRILARSLVDNGRKGQSNNKSQSMLAVTALMNLDK